jgi:hypothetical protein
MKNIRGCFIFCVRSSLFLISISLAFVSYVYADPLHVPTGQHVYSYIPAPEPRKSSDPSFALPMGIGSAATGGQFLDLSIGFSDFSAPVDIYLGIMAPSISPEILLVTASGSLQPISQGMAKWREGVITSTDQTVFASIPLNSLPEGTYDAYALVTPAGRLGPVFSGSLGSAYYLWNTRISLPLTNSPGLGSIGDIPGQLLLPEGHVDEIAAALAKEVLSGGLQTLPALLSAAGMAGFDIKHGGEIISQGQGSQGISIDAFELQLMAVLLNLGFSMPLDDITSDLVSAAPDIMSGDELKNIIIDGIREHAQNSTGPHRFWARFVVELGKQSSPSYDILNSSIGDISMNTAQINFILWRLSADISVMPGLAPALDGASAEAEDGYRVAQVGSGSSPCEFTNPVSDFQAAAAKAGFGKIYGWLDKLNNRTGFKSLKFGTTIFNTAFTYMKFAAQLALYDGKVKIDGDPPLHRTKYTGNNGEQRDFKFKARYDGDNLQWINCFRTAFNIMGLDFTVPNGPIQGADVQWKIYKGGNIIMFAPGQNPVKGNITNENGETSIKIEGRAQKKQLPQNAKKVTKSALVVTEVAAKMNNPKDIAEILPSVFGGAKILITLPTKLFERTHWLTSGYDLQVEDWSEDLTLSFDSLIRNENNCGSNFKWTAHVQAKDIDLSPDCDDVTPNCSSFSGSGILKYVSLQYFDSNTCPREITNDGSIEATFNKIDNLLLLKLNIYDRVDLASGCQFHEVNNYVAHLWSTQFLSFHHEATVLTKTNDYAYAFALSGTEAGYERNYFQTRPHFCGIAKEETKISISTTSGD